MNSLFILLVIGAVLWFTSRQRRAKTDLQAQDAVERLAATFLAKYPAGSDEEIAQLLRDELLNHKARQPLLFKWASAETVGRVRRTVVREVLSQSGPEPGGSAGSKT